MTIKVNVSTASARCITKKPPINIALSRGENIGLKNRQRVRSVAVTPRKPLVMSNAAVFRSSKSAVLAGLRSQCHHNGNIVPIASAICILCQVFGLRDGGLPGALEKSSDRLWFFEYRDEAYQSRCEYAEIRRCMIITTARTNKTSAAIPVKEVSALSLASLISM
jgi:hypothetical protein